MAESKITHAGGLKLPEPEWLKLKALAERWTSMSGVAYDIDNLLGLAVKGSLQISIHCPLVIPHVLKPRIKMTEVRYRTKQGIPESGVFGVSPFDIERLLAGEVFAPDSVLPNSVLTFDSETSSVVFVPTADNTLKVENLIVTREEIERFEQYYFQPEELAVLSEAAVPSEEAEPKEPAAPSDTAPVAKNKPGRPKDPNSLGNRIPELEADAIEEAKAFKAKHNRDATVAEMARALSVSDKWCHFQEETIKPCLRAVWWK